MPTSRSILRHRVALVIFIILLALVGYWPRLDLGDVFGLPRNSMPTGTDKILHVVGFAGLLLLLLGSEFTKLRGLKKLAAHVIPLALFAFAAELAQGLSAGRGQFDLHDVLASLTGLVVGSGVWLFIRWLSAPATSHFDHARIMTGLTLVSRFTGLFRDVVLPIFLGFGWIYDAYCVAFMIPNLFRRLFGEGALAGAFVPHYAKLEKTNPELGDAFGQTITGALWRVLAVIALLITLGCLAVWWFGGGGGFRGWGGLTERGHLIAGLTALSVWYMPLVCVAAILGAMLQVHGRFGVPSASPLILNLLVVLAALAGGFFVGTAHAQRIAVIIVIGALIGGILQILWHVHALHATGRRSLLLSSPSAILRDNPAVRAPVRDMLIQWFPTALGLAVFQINTLMDTVIATLLSAKPGQVLHLFGHAFDYPMKEGAVGVLASAQRLYEFPLGVFAIPVATAFFPALARAADDRASFSELVRQGLRLTVFIGLPAALGLILVRDPLCHAMFAKAGSIRENDYQRVAWVLLGYAPAIWAYSANHILVRAFYAHHNPKTPMRVSVAMVALNIVLNLTLVWIPLSPGAARLSGSGLSTLGAAGLAWSTAICAVVQFLILLRLVRRYRYVDQPIDRSVVQSWSRCVVLTGVMGAAVWALVRQFDVASLTRSQSVALLLAAAALGGVIYLAAAAILKMPELHWAIARKK
ncbi:MAG: murein biosynthesis integral membrane protein MurJ [Phycisphaerales bacterium]